MKLMLTFLRDTLEKALDVFFPQKAITNKLIALMEVGGISNLPSPVEQFSSTVSSLFSYKDALVRELVWQIKYKRNRKLTDAVGKLLYEVILEDIGDKNFFEQGNFLLIPIPMGKNHRRERGWNQTEDIAKAILQNDTEKLIAYSSDTLVKIKETESQTKTRSKRERLENLRGSFSVAEPELVLGKRIILIDDVVTTGSTIAEAKRVLKTAGAKNIYTYTIAH
jgi:ComF family protein